MLLLKLNSVRHEWILLYGMQYESCTLVTIKKK